MMMRPVITAALLLIWAAGAVPLAAASLDGYPPVVAWRGSCSVTLHEVSARIADAIAPLDAVRDRHTIARLFRQAVEERVFLHILHQQLREDGITVDRSTAQRYIDRRCERFGVRAEGLRRRLTPLILQPEFRLKAALHLSFEKRMPEAVRVSDIEIEKYYRLNQKRFLRPGRVDAGVILFDSSRPDSRRLAGDAAARLRQGEDFTAVAKEYNPGGSVRGLTPELMAQIRDPRRGQVLEVSAGGKVAVVMIRSRTPESYHPLEAAAPLIAEELEAAKVSLVMQKLLTAELIRQPVRYAADIPCLVQEMAPETGR